MLQALSCGLQPNLLRYACGTSEFDSQNEVSNRGGPAAIEARWNGNGGGRRWGPGVQSSSAETEPGGAQMEFPAAETDVDGAQIVYPVVETDVEGTQIEYSVAKTGSGDAQWEAGTEVLPISVDALRLCSSGGAEARRHDVVGTAVGRAAGYPCISGAAGAGRDHVLGTAVRCAAGRAGPLGRRAKRSQVRFERPEAGSLDSFDDTFLSCRTESPSSRVARVTSALHNLCPVHSSSILAHNSHARMRHARCVVNSVGDAEDWGRFSCVFGRTKSTSTSTRTGGTVSCCREVCFSTAGTRKFA